MKFKKYIESHQLFTIGDLRCALDSLGSLNTSLARALLSGEVERVKRGLYVSKTGKFLDEKPDAHLVVTALDKNAVFIYHSALELLGLAHSVSFVLAFASTKIADSFTYDGVSYRRYPLQKEKLLQDVRSDTSQNIKVTSREQTLVDCLEQPGRAGGLEEVIRSLTSIRYLDCDAIETILQDASIATIARVGWFLSLNQKRWQTSDAFLEELKARLGKGPYRLGLRKNEKCQAWVNEWKLCLPETLEEILSWMK